MTRDREQPLVEEVSTSLAALGMRDVVVSFDRGDTPVRALNGVSFEMQSGEVMCLLGPNGAGKTTTINTITGLVRVSSGAVAVFGFDPATDRTEVLRRVSLVPQETALYEELTARENLQFHGEFYGVGRRDLPLRIDEVLDLVGLVERQHHRVVTYSGGMRRRLALGRALLTHAPLVLLDEPTLGVDVQSRNAIWERIRWLAGEGTAVLLTTNYMDEADHLADTILLIDQGRVVARGVPAALKAELGRKELRLTFADERGAKAAGGLVPAEWPVAVDGRHVTVPADTTDMAALLEMLPQAFGDSFSRVEGFELREPSLQDVFLHYTGRSLRS